MICPNCDRQVIYLDEYCPHCYYELQKNQSKEVFHKIIVQPKYTLVLKPTGRCVAIDLPLVVSSAELAYIKSLTFNITELKE